MFASKDHYFFCSLSLITSIRSYDGRLSIPWVFLYSLSHCWCNHNNTWAFDLCSSFLWATTSNLLILWSKNKSVHCHRRVANNLSIYYTWVTYINLCCTRSYATDLNLRCSRRATTLLDGTCLGELLPCWASADVDVGVSLGLGASLDAGVSVWFILAKSQACTSRLEK